MLINNLERIEKHYQAKVKVEALTEEDAKSIYLQWLKETDIPTQETQ